MKELYEKCCGIDIHRDTAVCCFLSGYGETAKKEIKTFPTHTQGIKKLVEHLETLQIQDVVIESTGIYWRPIFNLLDRRFRIVLANAYHVKNAKGRKTDVKDSEWLCRLFKSGAISASFIPLKPIRRLRELTRYRLTLVREISRVKNRIIKTLECANIKLASVFSNVFGQTSWAIVEQLINGETCMEKLTSYINGRVKTSREDIKKALEGVLEKEDLVLLQRMKSQMLNIERELHEIEREIDKHKTPFTAEINRLIGIPGISTTIATTIVSEIGVDMEPFPTHEKLASWAALCPGHNESAGKQRSSKTRRGNNYLKTALVQAAWAASRTKDSYLQSKYRAMASRKGSKKAIIAVAHKILIICYYIIKEGRTFHEVGANFLDQLNADRKIKYHVKRLEELGIHISTVEKITDGELVHV